MPSTPGRRRRTEYKLITVTLDETAVAITGPRIHCVTGQKSTSEMAPATSNPRYSAFMILPPARALTNMQPTIDARIETPEMTSG